MKRNAVRLVLSALVVVAVVVGLTMLFTESKKELTVRYGITPYQDSALPVVAHQLGWYEQDHIDVELVPVTWGEVVNALVGGAIDVAIYNFNSFQPPYENAAKGRNKPVFYCPFYVFKGQAIMVHGDSGIEPLKDVEGEPKGNRDKRVVWTAKQLKGKRVAITKGTELEQIVLAALGKAGLDSEKDVRLIHSSPEDALAAFLAKDVDAFAAGLTERVEARRHGAVELLVTADVMLPVIDGIVTTESFARNAPEILDKLVQIWMKTIRFMEKDLGSNSKHILQYLAKAASTKYSREEYQVAWTFNIFPKTAPEANALFNDESSPYFWKVSWDKNNEFLVKQRKTSQPVPHSAYWGETVLQRLSRR